MPRLALRRAAASLYFASHVLAVTGCSTWQPAEANVSTLLAPSPAGSKTQPASGTPGMPGMPSLGSTGAGTEEVHLSRIRVSTAARGLIELRNPRVSNDTLYGQMAKNAPETAVPVADIRYVEVWKNSSGRTVLMVCSVLCSLVVVVGGLNLATM